MCDCLFCKIIAGGIPSSKVYEDENVFAFKDINPQAPVHVLIVPKKHVENVLEAAKTAPETIEAVTRALPKVAEAAGVEQFRLITNCGEEAAQSVKHLHFHLLGGARLSDRMACAGRAGGQLLAPAKRICRP